MKRLAQRLRRRATDERGAALIFVAVGLPVFVAFGIFVIDVGNWWRRRPPPGPGRRRRPRGAREFRFPVCSDKDIEEAVDYSGGVLADPDGNYAAFEGTPLAYNHQLAASARPTGPTQGLHTQITHRTLLAPGPRQPSGRSVARRPGPRRHDGRNRKPCSAQMLDVKMTETDIGGRFSPLRFLNVLGFVDYIDAQARVELRALEATAQLLPLAVEDVNPKRVHVWLDEDTQELLGEAELNLRDPEDGLLMYDNSVAGGGTPMTIDLKRETINGEDVTKQ